ncbi:ankyrin-repeat and fibronectin type III domain-containing 1 isoform X4 [Macrobrachium rosenbergii]|uniref:ankyrin-repeat and fibronectin type III domain-containing 1 isoform X4 n=1 Tax=Macrobrachium rosenbergii TaxID=79674 RepID=UPI0034D68775
MEKEGEEPPPSPSKGRMPSVSFGTAAFILIRVKRAFKKKRAKLKSSVKEGGVVSRPPLVRSRTLPAIVVPGVTVVHTALDASDRRELEQSGLPPPALTPTYPWDVASTSHTLTSWEAQFGHASLLQTELMMSTADVGGTSPHQVVPADSPIRPLLTVTTFDNGGSGSERSSTSRLSCGDGDLLGLSPTSGSPGGLKVPGAVAATSGGLGRIARLLVKDTSRSAEDSFRRRTHSLESKNGAPPLRRAASIDSLVDNSSTINNNNNITTAKPGNFGMTKSNGHLRSYLPVSPALIKRPSFKFEKTQATPDLAPHHLPVWPTTPSNFLTFRCRSIITLGAMSTMDDVLMDGLNLSKADRKKLEKISKINIHLHALFAAVEHGQMEKARSILDNNQLDINSVNSDGVNVLEIAVMYNRVSLAKMLQQAGATESNSGNYERRLQHLTDLVTAAERRRADLDCHMSAGAHARETERQLELWNRRVSHLRNMKTGLEQMKPPGPPSAASVEVIDSTRVKVTFREPEKQPQAITTKFKVEWSMDEWATVGGSLEIHDMRRGSVFIDSLTQGKRHHFRVRAGNMKDYGPPLATTPPAAIPSSWRDPDTRKPRLDGQIGELDDLFNQVCNSRPQHAAEIKAIEPGLETPLNLRKAQKKKSIKNLFSPAPKFHRNLKRGCYLACLIYCEDKVLVTTEEFPPVVEVDDNYMSQARPHFHWLLKIATTWEDVKSLRQDMERAGSASTVPFRIKLLQAAANMQATLGIQDLGQFYHEPIKDSNGTLVFCTIRHIKSTKSISAMNVKWVPLSKLREKRSSTSGQGTTPTEPPSTLAGDLLLTSLQEYILYDQVSRVPLRRGLYLGYLKLKSSVDVLQVLVPEKTPNVFPHVKIRDNPHVSREEWEWLQSLESATGDRWHSGCEVDAEEIEREIASLPHAPSPAQIVWHSQVGQAAHQLLNQLEVEEKAKLQHRLYCKEVLELSPDVAFLLVMPPVDAVCSAPGQEDALLTQPSLTTMPLQVFEMIHMGTYQRELIGRYARLSYILEMDTLMAQHASREAFSQEEISYTRDRLWQLQSFQEQLDVIWRGLRWVMDAITYARDKAASGAILATLLTCPLPSITLQQPVQHSPSHIPVTSSSSSHDTHSSSESLQHGADSKRLRKDDVSYTAKKSEMPRMLKSKTSENIRAAVKCEPRFHKSKTAECLLSGSGYAQSCGKSYNSLNECLLSGEEQNENVPLLTWTTEKMDYSGERKMYSRDLPTSRSENHLQRCVDTEYPPRKASAPAFFDTHEGCLKSKCCNSDPRINQSSSSLESVEQANKTKHTDVEYEETIASSKSPTSSCFDLHQRYSGSNLNVDIQRAGSSLSHDSEASFSSMNASLRSLSSNENENDTLSLMSGRSETSEARSTEGEELLEGAVRSEEPAIIQVYAAYETGLASGTSVKLQITPRTTAREVIDLVVKQLNMAVVLKGKGGPTYGNDRLRDFVLVAVIGIRERCLRDDFRPLQLQNPWIRGKLYVRLRHDVLAALEQSNSRHSAYL